jgi:hypothetical protein
MAPIDLPGNGICRWQQGTLWRQNKKELYVKILRLPAI